jgi:hypothetical protein
MIAKRGPLRVIRCWPAWFDLVRSGSICIAFRSIWLSGIGKQWDSARVTGPSSEADGVRVGVEVVERS